MRAATRHRALQSGWGRGWRRCQKWQIYLVLSDLCQDWNSLSVEMMGGGGYARILVCWDCWLSFFGFRWKSELVVVEIHNFFEDSWLSTVDCCLYFFCGCNGVGAGVYDKFLTLGRQIIGFPFLIWLNNERWWWWRRWRAEGSTGRIFLSATSLDRYWQCRFADGDGIKIGAGVFV